MNTKKKCLRTTYIVKNKRGKLGGCIQKTHVYDDTSISRFLLEIETPTDGMRKRCFKAKRYVTFKGKDGSRQAKSYVVISTCTKKKKRISCKSEVLKSNRTKYQYIKQNFKFAYDIRKLSMYRITKLDTSQP